MEEKFRFNTKSLKERRRELRRNQTNTEKILWELLRGRRLDGFKFYRQYSIGPYVVDFYCPQLRLAIEIDGSQHTEREIVIYDKERSNYFNSVNIQILRFWNEEIEKNVEVVLEKIKKHAKHSINPRLN